MRKLMLSVFILVFAGVLNAQEKTFSNFDFGLGIGPNYGGFGFNMAYAPIPFLSVEGCFGYNLHIPNVGGAINLHIIPKNNLKTYNVAFKTMYGYNAVLVVLDGDMESKSFYGLSFGLSNKLRFGRRKKSGVDVDLIIPIRANEVDEYYNELNDNGYDMSPLMPFSISVGYHLEF